MLSALTGFAVVGFTILVGYVVGRVGILGTHGSDVLGRLVFFVLSPFLFFTLLESADLRGLFSGVLPVSALAAISVAGLYAAVAIFRWRRPGSEVVVGSLSAAYVNSGNIGIPLSAYLLGDAAYSIPVILLQTVIFTPAALATLESFEGSQRPGRRLALVRVLGNPVLVASALGITVSVLGVEVPTLLLEPMQFVAAASVPVLLISFGLSLTRTGVGLEPRSFKQVALASILKLLIMPALAWAIASFMFALGPSDVFVITFLAALPTAQTVFNFSQRYRSAEPLSRDTTLITTVLSVPVLVVIVLVLG